MNIVENDNLWRQYTISGNSEAKEKLIKRYIPLVQHIVEKMNINTPSYIDHEDLVSYGLFGLLQAIDRFDLKAGTKFTTFAYTRIKGSIIDELRKTEKIPTSTIKKFKILQEALAKLEQELSRAASDNDLCRYLNITTDKLYEMYNEVSIYSTAIPFEDLVYTSEYRKDCGRPDVFAEKQEIKKILTDAINRLPKQERLVVTLYYYEDLTFKEIAEVMKLSQGRISQLHTKAILRLRGRLCRNRALIKGGSG
ncbi:MAG: FliA/WhiG family RNA polymerase sigma factor [Thermoanaerobacterales bacterium]|nr:FliA/WhiG family RNA polymerase sigma factor [Thermoanaerobacterales bacterium]